MKDTTCKTISEKKTFTDTKVNEFKKHILTMQQLPRNYSIYITGSFARGEGTEYSDMDLFFIFNNDIDNLQTSISRIDKILIDAELIKIVRKMNMPDFSRDGEFLKIHQVSELVGKIGSQDEDYLNLFTARLLLILESKPIYNEDTYNLVLEKTINTYYKDFHDHNKMFLPTFLTNDIIRFWKTLTLNYEHSRNRRPNDIDKNKSHIKNLKLKFSRKLTCFSFILQILFEQNPINENTILKISKMTSLERINHIGENNKEQEDNIDKLLDLYAWFLDAMHKPNEELLNWISDTEERIKAFDKATQFSDAMYEIMKTCNNKDVLKYLIL